MEKQGYSTKGKKLGRVPKYKTQDAQLDARRAQQRTYINRKRAGEREAKAAAKAEAEVEAKDEDEVPLVPMPETVNVEDEEERLAHCVRTKSKQKRVNLCLIELKNLGQ